MKLKSCFVLMCMMAAMLSCSDNDEPQIEQPKQPVIADVSLALAAQTADRVLKTLKADDGTENTIGDGTISSLTAVVFVADESGVYGKSGYKTGDIVFMATKSFTEQVEEAQISGIGLAADHVEILLIANAESDLIASISSLLDENKGIGHNNKETVFSKTTLLSNEVEYTKIGGKGLTMTKLLSNIQLLPGNNFIGFADKGNTVTSGGISGTELYGNKVEVVRTVSRVELNSLKLESSDKFESVSFKLDTVFLANVKSLSGISDGRTLSGGFELENVEVAFNGKDDFYWVGDKAWENETGIYKVGKAQSQPFLMAKIDGNKLLVNNSLDNTTLKGLKNKYFYVYSNLKGEVPADNTGNNYTLLIVKGDYTHKVEGKDVTLGDRYYTVIVNDPAFRGAGESGPGYDHIRRNTKYWVNLTIAGSGSDKPYDPSAYAHVSAQVVVTPWTVVKIDETVD